MDRSTKLGALFSVLVGIFRILVKTFTPLYLDCLNPVTKEQFNITNGTSHSNWSTGISHVIPSIPAWQRIDPFIGIWLSMGFDTLALGSVIVILYLCVPGQISDREWNYPKRGLLMSGGFQAVSAVLLQFSTSGTRTAPYLQAALGYFLIPIIFILRFAILHKKPTRRKLVCVIVVFSGEIICLLPAMIPSLESNTAKEMEGGASGIARILWPMLLVFQMIPHALWNILLEKGAKEKAQKQGHPADITNLNMAFVMFWNFLGTFITAILIFWIDLIPGFGLLPDIRLFFPLFWFNLKCIFGATEVCGFHQVFVAWGRIISKTSYFVAAGFLVRYGEGASVYGIIVAVVIPMQFLVFALFDEPTSRWHPHATLSTWLSVGALLVMVPAVIMYNTAPESTETNQSTEDRADDNNEHCDEADPLLQQTSRYGSINTEPQVT